MWCSCILLNKNFGQNLPKKVARQAKSIFTACTLGPSGVSATLRPHQMLRGNATSHDSYRYVSRENKRVGPRHRNADQSLPASKPQL